MNRLQLSIIGFSIFLIIVVILWIYSKSTLRERNCDDMDYLYKDFPKLHNINVSNEDYQHNLRDYYIKSAYNCCCAGDFKNDYVDLCALKNCIKQGVRCLDFEIYSLNNKPVIATSSVNDYNIKETYNSIDFADALDIIQNYAFSGSTCPNPNDPLIIHLRVMSNNINIYNEMAKQINNSIEDKVLGSQYSYENHGVNLGVIPLKELLGKVIISIDKSNPLFENTELDEYVNIASNSIFMRCLRYHDVKYTPDMDELVDFNKKNITLCIPDLSSKSDNPSASLIMKLGCQMPAMCFQTNDSNLQHYNKFFEEAGTAFALKPASLRYVPVTIEPPQKAPEHYSYKQREVSSDYYNFKI